MSFMFNPYPYDDPVAFNRLDDDGIDLAQVAQGSVAAAATAARQTMKLLEGKTGCVVAIDGYATAPLQVFCNLMEQQLAANGIAVQTLPIESLWQEEGLLNSRLKQENLPEDRVKDPVLLYGKLFEGCYEDVLDAQKLADAVSRLRVFAQNGKGVLLLWGYGALCDTLCPLSQQKIYLDTTPMHAMLRLKHGEYRNIGTASALPFKMMARRCYYVDFELSAALRFKLLHQKLLDSYVIANDRKNMTLLPAALLEQVFVRAMEYPLRCKPVYLEGVWGGYYIQRLRNLPVEMKNCAWVFDMIPMEVSIVFILGSLRLEFPFYTLVQSQGQRLMGERSVKQFGHYFPLRFNYDDTYHSNGNMSIQCHPGEEYVKENNGELGRQDESYYIVEAGQGARTYLGFQQDADVEQFVADVRRSEEQGTSVDYQKYVYSVDSKPGTQVMIPAGTIHASGRNQLILEIGSLTVGSYTYKMYDYLRKDLDGNPRPIHTYHGDKVLQRGFTADWVASNLVNGGKRTLRSGRDWEEFVVGEHDLLYFSLRNVRFVSTVEDDTAGDFHVLTLVDGEQALIRSKKDSSRSFTQNYLDIVVVPADFGPYEVINLRKGTTCIEHKTMLKPQLP